MLYQLPSLETSDLEVIGLIERLWKELRHNLSIRPRKWTGTLAKNLRAMAIQGSNSIEGYVVSHEAALAALGGEMPEETDETSWTNVVHYREAMDYVLRLADATDYSYSKGIICSLHFIMLRHETTKNPGTWRPGAIRVVNEATSEVVYVGPPAENIAPLIQALCDQLNADDGEDPHRMVRAAMAHLNLVMIHPFSDGNGRMARCLQTLVLARGGLLAPTFSSIEEYLGRNTQAYYNVLAKVGGRRWNPKKDVLPWIRFCLTAHYRQAYSVHRRLERVAELFEGVEKTLADLKLPERAAASLVNATLGFRLRNEDYRRDAEVSMHLASRDLKALVSKELLASVGEKRGRHYEAGPLLVKLAEDHPRGAPILDPYEIDRSRAHALQQAADWTHGVLGRLQGDESRLYPVESHEEDHAAWAVEQGKLEWDEYGEHAVVLPRS